MCSCLPCYSIYTADFIISVKMLRMSRQTYRPILFMALLSWTRALMPAIRYHRSISTTIRRSPWKSTTNNMHHHINKRGVARLSSLDPSNEVDLLMEEVENHLLPKLFGHESFRPGQREVVRKVLSGESCLAILPTGSGKSLLYTLPSQMLDGLTLVVSPLMALMRDQVDALQAQDIGAVRIDSSMTYEEVRESMRSVMAGKVKILFVSPERFNNENFRKILETLKVAMFVVDEAHCISEWGHAFRPDYLRLSHFATATNAQVRLALTATATKRVASDILERLDISSDNVVRLPSTRSNLALSVQRFDFPKDGYNERLDYLLEILPEITSRGPALIFVGRQKLAERLAADLVQYKYNAKGYHAGMDSDTRKSIETWFLERKTSSSTIRDDENKNAVDVYQPPIVVGTSAFGMGIDKGNIRAVIHFDLPRSVEDYVQGCGRAGRDGQPSACVSLLADSDIPGLRSQIFGLTPTLSALQTVSARVFGQEAFLAKYDSALYTNYYDLSFASDISDLQLRLCMSHLVQQGLITELTPAYEQFKVSLIKEGKLEEFRISHGITADGKSAPDEDDGDWVKETVWESGNTGGTTSDEDENDTLDELMPARRGDSGTATAPNALPKNDFERKKARLGMLVAEYLKKQQQEHPRRKTTTMNTIDLANQFKVTPHEIGGAVSLLVKSEVVDDKGVSRIYNRFKLLKAITDTDEIAHSLHELCIENQRRGLARADEVVSLLREGSKEGSDMWNAISQYFDEEVDTTGFGGQRSTKNAKSVKSKSTHEIRELAFDEACWAEVVALVHAKVIPADDPLLIARFATGVISPRLMKLKLSRHEVFGKAMRCDWQDVVFRSQQLVDQMDGN